MCVSVVVAVMAAPSNNFVRLRLHFDYPPPAVVDCRLCWLLVDLKECRVVADVESLIRDKFGFSSGRSGTLVSLFVEGCYLPHTESAFLLRDNDTVRVKVDCVAQVNGSSPTTSRRKRRRPAEEEEEVVEGPGENGVNVKRKKDRVEAVTQPSGDDEKKKKKKKKKRKKAKETHLTVTPTPAASKKPKKTPTRVNPSPKSSKKPPPVTKAGTSSDSSSSEEDEGPKKPAPPKPAPKPSSSSPSAAATPRTPPPPKPKQAKPRPPPSSSSDSSSSSSDEAPPKTTTTTTTPKGSTRKSQPAPPTPRPTNSPQIGTADVAPPPGGNAPPPGGGTMQAGDSDSDDEIKLVIRRPVQQQLQGVGGGAPWRGRGRGRGQRWRGGGAEGGAREGRGGGRGSFQYGYNGVEEPSCQTDRLTNVSVVHQNGGGVAPQRDYLSLPLLAAPPQVGQKIAFKLLELTENYTPEISEYKEGKILSFDFITKQIKLELLTASAAPVEPGKFDLVYQNPDGSESVEYAVSRGSQVTERWESLLEPRLII